MEPRPPVVPRYPVYVPSKGRAENCTTPRLLRDHGIPFHLVVEPQEAEAYGKQFGSGSLVVLPFRDRGSVVPARNFAKEHAISRGFARHWQMDDDMRGIRQMRNGKRVPCRADIALSEVENFVDQWDNVAIAGLRSMAFLEPGEFIVNRQVYGVVLVASDRFRWRGIRGEDTDYSLQVLSSGFCTLLINRYLFDTVVTGSIKGGNTDETYKNDGRVAAVREMQRRWPHTVKLTKRHGIPRMALGEVWRKFDHPLKPRTPA